MLVRSYDNAICATCGSYCALGSGPNVALSIEWLPQLGGAHGELGLIPI